MTKQPDGCRKRENWPRVMPKFTMRSAGFPGGWGNGARAPIIFSERSSSARVTARLLEGQGVTLHALRDYSALLKVSDILLEIDPDNKWALADKISVYQDIGDLKTAAKLLPQPIDSDRLLLLTQTTQWLYERRYDEAIKALTAALLEAKKPNMWFERQEYLAPLAMLYHVAGKTSEAQATARALKETLTTDPKSDVAIYDCARLAEVYAFLGDKEKAIAALQPLKTEKDVALAVDFPNVMAEIGAVTSDKEMALTYLAIAARTPCDLSYGDLEFNPLWDALRGDARFEQIANSLAPK